jgi:hypothetical protein
MATKFDDRQPLDEDTRTFLNAFADALDGMRTKLRKQTRENARPKSDRAEVSASNESLYRTGLKQFLAAPNDVKRAPRLAQGTNVVVAKDSSLTDALKASLSRAHGAFEQRRGRGR